MARLRHRKGYKEERKKLRSHKSRKEAKDSGKSICSGEFGYECCKTCGKVA